MAVTTWMTQKWRLSMGIFCLMPTIVVFCTGVFFDLCGGINAAHAGMVLTNATARYGLQAPGAFIPQTWVYGSTAQSVDGQLDYGSGGVVSGVAGVTITFSDSPSADVEVSVSTTGSIGGNSIATVDMNYQVALIETRPIPTILPYSQIPISVTGSALVEIMYGSGAGQAWVVGPGIFNILVRTNPPGGPTSITETRTISLTPGQSYNVDLHANVSVAAISSDYIPSGAGQAVADPVFAFDQATFAQWMDEYGLGDQVWNLADYFAFQYSPNLAAPCQGDCDQDEDVDGSDLTMFIVDYLAGDPTGACSADYNADGQVNGLDLSRVATCFGRTNCIDA